MKISDLEEVANLTVKLGERQNQLARMRGMVGFRLSVWSDDRDTVPIDFDAGDMIVSVDQLRIFIAQRLLLEMDVIKNRLSSLGVEIDVGT